MAAAGSGSALLYSTTSIPPLSIEVLYSFLLTRYLFPKPPNRCCTVGREALPARHSTHLPQESTTEILVLSIQSAIGSFGGVLSLVSSVLVLFFGAGRVAPFGLVQKWLLRSSTKAKIRKAYRNDHINDMDEKQGSLASSFQSSLEGEPQAHHHRELKVLERRVKELETVLRDLYLDMKLIDTDDEQDQVSTNTTEEV